MSFETPLTGHKLGNIQALRGFAALNVVASHLHVIEMKYSPDHLIPKTSALLLSGVDLFFAISGFIMIYVILRMGRGPKAVLEFLYARVTRIYPLYWIVTCIVLAVYVLRPELVFSSIDKPPNLIKSFLLWPEGRPPLLAVGWTLIHEMGFYLVVSVLLFFKRSWVLPFLILWAVLVVLAYQSGIYNANALYRVLGSPLSLTFILGALGGYIFCRFGPRFGLVVLVIGLGLWGTTLVILAEHGGGMIENHFGRFIHFGLPSALVVYGCAALKTEFPRWSQTLGDWSYALYLTHVLTLTALGRLWNNVATQGLWDNVLAAIMMTAISVIVAALFYNYAEKPLLQRTRIWRKKWFERGR